MTSLSKQLETLRTATAGQLTVEKRHVSLLFDRQEAEKLDRETVFKIGSTGYAQLKKLDLTSFDDCDEFFEETVLNFQRTMISKAENQALDVKLERFIFKLSPYLLHFSCQQVLEWLIHRYQIHAYNAEFLMSAFLPFHDTNLYGRLLSIIEFNFATSKDWAFLQEFGKLQIPVPFRIIIKNALSSKHSLLSRISDHIDKALSIVGADFLETKSSHLFTFYAKVTLATLDQAKQADDGLISKIVPMLGNGLRSPIASFRNASMMIICQLCLTVKLAVPIRSSITKILMMKLRETTLTTSLSTLIVVCQLQGIESFSKKATLKLIRRADSLGIWTALQTLAEQTDLQAFLDPFWTSLFEIVQNEETSDEDREAAFKAIQKTGEVTRLSPDQARIYLTQLLAAYSTGLSVPKVMEKEVYNLCLRFSNEWEELLVEWTARDRETLDRFVKTFKLKNLVAIPTPELRKRHRRRSNSMRKSISESQEQHKQTAEERAQAMATASEFAKRVKFSGDPIRKAMEWITSEDIENLSWALEEMSVRPTYLSNQLEEDVEEFAVRAVKFAENQSPTVMEKIKSAMATANLPADFVVSMLSRHELNPSKAKKSKGKERLTPERAFEDQKDEEYWTRAKFVVETLTVSVKRSVNQKLYALLFDMLKESQSIQNGQLQYSVQHSLISLLIKMISSPGSYKITIKDLQIDPVVETMRSTASHHILRDSLKLLTAAVQLNPNSVTSHIMSVFTFMGSGLLRKDNDLTLDIIERTVEALFTAVVNNQSIQKPEIAQKLIAVTKVFAASAPDIPAHRRARMARAISRAVGVEGAWLVACVMIEGFCAKWQRNDPNKKNTEQDAFEDIAQELSASLDPAEQLSVVLDLVQFVVRLGGDQNPPKKSLQTDTAIFDRTKFTVQKLRHFRFVLVGIAVKILSNRQLLDKLSRTSDEELYETMLPIGQRLMTASVELDEFGAKESQMAEKSADPQTLRYWVALQGRSDTVSEKLRFLLPGGVAARLISNVLEDEKTESRMREKVLQLANVKLLTDGFFYTDSGINERHLSRLASVLNKWIAPHRSDPAMIELCKNATFSLKLVAKRIPKQSESAVLTETMEKAVELVNQWQSLDESMVGNVLFLAGELIRSHNMRCTMLSCEPLLQVCLSIIGEYLSASQKNKIQEEETSSQTKRQRVRQQSLSGRKLGSDTLLIASLSCLQRILDQFAAFVTSHLSTIFIAFARLSGKFPILEANPVPAKGTVQHRLSLINVALSNLEFRTLPGHFATAVREIAPEEKSLAALMSLLSSYFHRFNRRNTAAACGQLTTEIFLPALEFRNLERKPEKFENVANVEKNVAKTMLKMADLLVESELRAVFTSLVKWAEVGLSADSSRDARVRLVVLFHFANEFYNYFNHLAMPYFGTLLEMAPKVLRGCNATQNPDTSTLLLSGKRDTVEGLETDLLLTQVITFIGNCGRHKEFLAQDCVSSLALALVEELVNTRVAGHEARCVPHLADALYRMCDAAAESFPDVLNKIMLKTRNNRPKIRFRTLLVVEALLDKIGDGIAPHLPLIMPFLSELLEDENKNVEDQCDRVIRLLQKKFGENISEGF